MSKQFYNYQILDGGDITMKIFLSWSGETIKKLALIFHEWLPSVIQSVEPYMSSEDIDKGARWSNDVGRQLGETSYGIIFITSENINAPWINFEAGALSKAMDTSLVSPFLLEVKNSDLAGPLTQFQSTLFDKEEIRKLLVSINKACSDTALSETRLNTVFDKWWPDLEAKIQEVITELAKIKTKKQPEKPVNIQNKKIENMLEEVLELTRIQQKILRSPEELFPIEFLEYLFRNINSSGQLKSAYVHIRRSLYKLEELITKYSGSESVPYEELKTIFHELNGPLTYVLRRNTSYHFRERLKDYRDEMI